MELSAVDPWQLLRNSKTSVSMQLFKAIVSLRVIFLKFSGEFLYGLNYWNQQQPLDSYKWGISAGSLERTKKKMPLEFRFKLSHVIVPTKLWNIKHATDGRAFRFSELFFIRVFWKLSQRSEVVERIKEEIPVPNQIPACTRQSVRWEKKKTFFLSLLLLLFLPPAPTPFHLPPPSLLLW